MTSTARSAGRSRRTSCGSSTSAARTAAARRSPACSRTRMPAIASAWTFVPDPNIQARNDNSTIANGLRLTWQMSQKSKLNLFWDSQQGCNGSAWIGTTAQACRQNPDGWIEGGTSTIAPEAAVYGNTAPQRIQQATYTNTLSSRMLFEFGYSGYNSRWGGPQGPGNPTQDFIQVREQGGSIPGLCYRSISTLCGTGFLDVHGLDLGEHVARQPVVRDRLAQHQVRLQRPVRLRQPGLELRQLAGDWSTSSTTACRTSSGSSRASSRASGARGTTRSSSRIRGRATG